TSLSPATLNNSYWLSPSGIYAFGFYPRPGGYSIGIFMAGIPQKTLVWMARRDDPPVPSYSTLHFTADGGLILQSTLDTLHSAASDVDPSTGIFRIRMQLDGNLVMYPNAVVAVGNAYWATSTVGAGDTVTLNLAGDGLLYLMNGTADKCAPTGLCGFNAFCINFDQVARCQCLPGFDFVQSGNDKSGCQRSFTPESCTAINAPASYNISVVYNTVWADDNSYSVVAVPSESDCRTECLQDCNCEAAFYEAGSCSKQRLPLRYGRRNLGSSNAVFVK
ncbi:hypothetical protein CRG98_044679, partial [Punica granatum]